MTTEQPKSSLPFFDCHKRVQAGKIAQIDTLEIGTGLRFEGDAADAPHGAIVNAEWVAKHNPEVGGYYVVYQDGYASFSPAEAFESGYTPFDPAARSEADVLRETLLSAQDTAAARDKEQAHKIADLEMALEDAAKMGTPATGPRILQPGAAVIPAGTVVRVNALPFKLVADGIVESSQAHVDAAVYESETFDAAPRTGAKQGQASGSRGDQLEKFLGRRAGERVTLTIAPRHSNISPVQIRVAPLDQTDALEGTIQGNTFTPR